MRQKADSDLVRRQNRTLLIETLRRAGPMARTNLGELTDLSPATVTAITADLINEGVVEATERSERLNGRGRPRVALALAPDAACVVGVKVVVGGIELLLADFAGTIIRQHQLDVDRTAMSDHLSEILEQEIQQFILADGDGTREIAQIGIAIQGVVNPGAGRVVWSPVLNTRDVDIAGPLSDRLGIPVFASNDANMIAHALHIQDPAQYSGTFAVMMVGYGVGMGLFVDGRLYEGSIGAAAEVGHMNHIPGGSLCRCGRRGCLEAYVADYALVRRASGLSHDSPPLDHLSTDDIAELAARADAGETVVIETFADAGRALGYGLARIAALLNPERIIVTGPCMVGWRYMEAACRSGMREALVSDLADATTVTALPFERDLVGVGIVEMALQRLDRDVFSLRR